MFYKYYIYNISVSIANTIIEALFATYVFLNKIWYLGFIHDLKNIIDIGILGKI